jgi:hypothetical protein
MRRCLKSLVVAGLAVVMMAAAGPCWAALKSVTSRDVRADVVRLHGVVSGCIATGVCDPEAVGEDLRVGDSKRGGYEVHWDWLREALDKSKGVDAGKRGDLLRDSAARLSRMDAELAVADGGTAGEKEFARARAEADSVLAEPEFQRKITRTWWDRVRDAFGAALGHLLAGLERVGTAAPWLGTVLIWTLCISAAAGLLFFVLRNLQRQRLRISLAGSAVANSAWDREATDWARQAEAFANKEEWREAVHCLYWAAIVSLESRKAWRHNPTRTPREYVRLLKAGSGQQRSLRELTRIFERGWYGLRELRSEEYAEARRLYDGLASGAVERAGGDAVQPIGVSVEGGVA